MKAEQNEDVSIQISEIEALDRAACLDRWRETFTGLPETSSNSSDSTLRQVVEASLFNDADLSDRIQAGHTWRHQHLNLLQLQGNLFGLQPLVCRSWSSVF